MNLLFEEVKVRGLCPAIVFVETTEVISIFCLFLLGISTRRSYKSQTSTLCTFLKIQFSLLGGSVLSVQLRLIRTDLELDSPYPVRKVFLCLNKRSTKIFLFQKLQNLKNNIDVPYERKIHLYINFSTSFQKVLQQKH